MALPLLLLLLWYAVDAWERAMNEAGAELRQQMLAQSISPAIGGGVRVAGDDGESSFLAWSHSGGPTVVGFWSAYCGPSIQNLSRINALADRLAPQGVRTLLINIDGPSEHAREIVRERGATIPVVYDVNAEAARTLQQFATPHYFILDRSGALRFADTVLELIPGQIAALR